MTDTYSHIICKTVQNHIPEVFIVHDFVCMCTRVSVCMCVRARVCGCVCVCTVREYVCMCASIHTYKACVGMYVCENVCENVF